MVEFKLVLGLKDGKSVQKVLAEPEANVLIGLKIGDKVSGDKIGYAGYEFELAGGSDYCGFPMRKDLPGSGRKKILITRGKGMNKKGKGLRKRVTVCGNTINDKVSQVNLKILKMGKAKLEASPKDSEEQGSSDVAQKPKVSDKGDAPAKDKAEKKGEPKKEKAPKEKKPAEKKEESKEEAK